MGPGGIECTSQCVDKNRRCQRVCLKRHRVCRYAGSVGFYPRAARYILCPSLLKTPCAQRRKAQYYCRCSCCALTTKKRPSFPLVAKRDGHMIKIGQLMATWLAISAVTSLADATPLNEDDADLQLEFPLGCIVRDYKFVVVRKDANGVKCRGKVETTACFGSCETGEYGTHKFPQREQTSNICAHDRSSQQTVMLTDCDEGVDPAIKVYTFKRAETCKCQPCNPSTMHCQSMAGKRAAPPGLPYKSEDGVLEKRRRVARFLAKLFAEIDQEYDDN